MKITVAYALPEQQTHEDMEVPDGTTVQEALRLSHVLEKHPEIDLEVNKVGVFAKLAKMDQVLKEGDRVEIYRPLPKKTRDPYADEKKAKIAAKKERKADEK